MSMWFCANKYNTIQYKSRILRKAWVPYGNMETSTPHSSDTSQDIAMKLWMFDYVGKTNTFAKFGWNPPARGRSTHSWNIHFLWLFFLPSFLPSCLLFLRTCTGQKRIEIISRSMAQKTQFGVRKCPPSKCFPLILRFGGHFVSKPPKFRPQ